MDVSIVVDSEEVDESCYIVENPLEIIEINESQTEDENLDVTERNCSATKELEPENDNISGFLVIDETGNDTNLNLSTITNGDINKTSEDPIDSTDVCAPKTPQPINKNNNNGDAERRVLIDIKFLNKKTYFAFHDEFMDVVKKYYRSKIDDMDILDDSAHNRLCISEKIVKKSESFLVDTTPKSSNENETTPRYTSLNTPVLSNLKRPREEEPRMSMSSNKCFNCDKDTHGLRDCPEPRNMNKIRRARNDFNRRELRYHDDNDEYSSSLVPGKLSDDLKVALGLSGNQIPLHVYKMRLYGYPPGWLEEAKIQHSGLQLFTGNESVNDDREKAFKFDVQKIHEFPGFNVPPEGQFVDKFRLLNVPPMLPEHSKEFFIKALGAQVINGYKKRKLRDSNVDSTVCDEVEMEIADDDDEEMIPLGKTCYQEPPPPGEESEDGEISSDNNSQSSLDLEKKKQTLLNALAAEDEPQSSKTRNCIDPVIIENSENENRDNSAKDIDVGHVETTVFGTPVLPSFSPFEILPAGDNFMSGVSDVIAFENLAESTGKYENMRELIKKVRSFQKQHQQE